MNEFDRLQRQAQRYKATYPPGTRISLHHMKNDPHPIDPDTRGTVDMVDDTGTVFCHFDNGRFLGMLPGVDQFRKLTAKELEEEQIRTLDEKIQSANDSLSSSPDREDPPLREIQTIESDRYEKTENGLLRHIGMINGHDLFDQLKSHLEANNLLPDEYFLPSIDLDHVTQIPDFTSAICNVNFGGSEGIFLDIDLAYWEDHQRKLFHLATGKTLDDSGDAFIRMGRIATECSMMLNGRGERYKVSDVLYPDKETEPCKPLAEQISSAKNRDSRVVSTQGITSKEKPR